MTLKRFCCLCFFAVVMTAGIYAKTSAQTEKDSLLTLLKKLPKAENGNRRLELLTHLTMLCSDKGEDTYAKELFKESVKLNNGTGIKISFYALVDCYSNVDGKLLVPYIEDVIRHSSGNLRNALIAYANMRIKYGELVLGSRSGNDKRIDELRTSILKKEGVNNDYDEVAWNALLGQFLLMYGGNYHVNLNAADYFNQSIHKAKSLPLDLVFRIEKTAEMGLANLYLADPTRINKAFEVLKEEENQLKQYKNYYKNYPFYNDDNSRMQIYAMYLALPQLLEKKNIPFYLSEYKRIVNTKRNTPQEAVLLDSYYATMTYYYQRIGDMKTSIVYVDSCINSAKRLGMGFQIPKRILWKAQTLHQMGEKEEALKAYEEYIPLNDSIYTSSTQDKVSELQTAYGLQREKAEKTEMELVHQHDLTILYVVILLMMLVIIIYQIVLHIKAKKEQTLKSQLLVAKEKALEFEKMKTTFTESMTRELRTPMNAIKGSAEMLYDKELKEDNRKIMVNMLSDNISYLNYLIDNMIEVSQLNTDSNKPVAMELASIYEICRIELINIKASANKPDIKDVFNIIENEDWVIGIHAHYFILMFHHILENAYHFTQKGTITIDGEILGDTIQISVSDTGIGIPEEKQDLIFESYTKLDEYSKGMGMGLYICKLIAKRLNGKVWIDKEYKNGTKVVFTLPCNPNMRLEKQ